MKFVGRKLEVSRTFLVASILLNIFLAALAGGQYLRHRAEESRHESVFERVVEDLTSHLDNSDAEAFRSALKQEEPHYAKAHENLALARADINRLLLAPNFDPAAAREAMRRWRLAWNAFVGSFGDALVDAMARISPAGRRAIVETMPKHKT
ncbi:periplasmic heavy metal sensor [Acidomonas methanolica]|uniref:periplasmic heavy metal sensor n=1 Tax=Acidomonas methanolica TaxID=437 RepID=UPI00211A9817|nr:periplasmic heavy metal sensor [Acidomonas methanolica]MCQ9156855.1 periplasmic heavy metal sensor [Acidomonas methanolica]